MRAEEVIRDKPSPVVMDGMGGSANSHSHVVFLLLNEAANVHGREGFIHAEGSIEFPRLVDAASEKVARPKVNCRKGGDGGAAGLKRG